MKKFIKITLIFILLLLTILCTKAFATTESLKPVSVEVIAPEAGIYGKGQKITIKCTFDKEIKGKLPKYKISFSDSGKEYEETKREIETNELTDFTKEVRYEYEITSGDNGELMLLDFSHEPETLVEDKDGNQYNVMGGYVEDSTTIWADTTIEWTNFSNVKIEPELKMELAHKSFNLKVEDCEWNTNNSYYIHLSHDKSEKITIKNPNEVKSNENGFWKYLTISQIEESKIGESLIKEIFVESGDVFLTICEIDSNTKVPKIVLKSKKIDKLDSLPIGQRLLAYFNDDETATFCNELHSDNQQNINYKIGKIEDSNLLKSLKDGQYSALQKLMEYAKKADSIGSGTVKFGKDNTITDKLNLVNDEYYYVYMQLDTVDGKYILIEDVMLYQALVSDNLGKNLFSMNDEKFEWKLEEPAPEGVPTPTPTPTPTPELDPKPEPEPVPTPEPEEKDETTSEEQIPHAGLEKTIVLLLVGITFVLIIALKKYEKYRDII